LGVSELTGLKLFVREIIFEELFQPLITVPKRYGRTDRQTHGQTDGMQSHNRALR